MENIHLAPLTHRGRACIALYFARDISINDLLKKLPEANWSRTHKCWYIPLAEDAYKKLVKLLKGKANFDDQELRQYLQNRKDGDGSIPDATSLNPVSPAKSKAPVSGVLKPAARLSANNKLALAATKQALILKGYSRSTAKTYLNELSQFLQSIKGHPAEEFTVARIKDYLQYCSETLHLSESTIHSRMNALKFYYEQVLAREKFFWEIPRPKKPLTLPKLLNETELRKLFNALQNKKHKAMLFTAYSAGLRVSEVVNLKIADIDSRRMQIFIERAKGKKDRYVNLSPVLLDILRKYLVEYKPRPKIYLFESDKTHTAYPTRTVQQIFSLAKHDAGISKAVGVHSLRHSFATHLLDKGTDIRYIKDILGHFNLKTTERYLHVSKKQLVNVVSPFDDLYRKEEIQW